MAEALRFDITGFGFAFACCSFGLVSNNILTDGEYVSSYCPLLKLHKNAIRKPTAIIKLIAINITIIAIS